MNSHCYSVFCGLYNSHIQHGIKLAACSVFFSEGVSDTLPFLGRFWMTSTAAWKRLWHSSDLDGGRCATWISISKAWGLQLVKTTERKRAETLNPAAVARHIHSSSFKLGERYSAIFSRRLKDSRVSSPPWSRRWYPQGKPKNWNKNRGFAISFAIKQHTSSYFCLASEVSTVHWPHLQSDWNNTKPRIKKNNNNVYELSKYPNSQN